MRILLDECVPNRLRNHLPQHECQTAQRAGFGGLENGELLEAAENARPYRVTVGLSNANRPWVLMKRLP
jgi:predicted nuclease of predicted toxin-antitoxin system